MLAVGAGAAVAVLTGCRERGAATPGHSRRTERYGSSARQYGRWAFPRRAGRRPVVMLLHGGFWQPGYGPALEARVARSVADRGLVAWNVDYRAADAAYPATFLDAAAALDYLRSSRYADRLDLGRVAVVGHSAGGHLALWLASRSALPPGAPGRPGTAAVRPSLVVGQAPVADLVTAAEQGLGGDAVVDLLDATPVAEPGRYAVASPQALLPIPAAARPRLLLVHGSADRVVPPEQSRSYAAAARAAGTPVTLREVPAAGHFDHLDPAAAVWDPVWRALGSL